MDDTTDREHSNRELLRRIAGQLPEARAREIDADLEASVELAREHRRLDRVWSALELPPPQGAPAGFVRRVLAHAEAPSRSRSAPIWVRPAAALALAAGVALGVGLAAWQAPLPDDESGYASFADAYRSALEAPAGELVMDGAVR